MKLSISRSRESIWVWLLWCLGIYLLMELGPFLLLGIVIKRAAGELVVPYLEFAVPCAIVAPLVWWLRRREGRDVSSKRLAHEWSLSVALFGVVLEAALFLSAAELRLMDSSDAWSYFIFAALFSTPIYYFTVYHRTLPRIAARSNFS